MDITERLSKVLGDDTEGPAVLSHFQCGVGRSGAPLDLAGGKAI